MHSPGALRNVSALAELERDLGPGGLITDEDVVESYRRDQATWAPAGRPLAVARPDSTAMVQEIARWASAHRVPIVARGAGSGLSGGASAVDGGLVLSFERMARILDIDRAAMRAVVQPGVLNGALKSAVSEHGLWYPPDPSSADISSIGGNVATNAGGLCCVKYGVTADYVLALEVVLADGRVIHTGGRTRKNVAGYDLTRLIVGSEGTLGLVTEITLRLRPSPPPATTLVASFPSLEASGRAVGDIVRRCNPALLEIMDRTTIRAVEAFQPLGLDTEAAALLLARSDARLPGEIERMGEACERAGAGTVITTDDEWEGDLLMNARRLALPSLERLGTVLVDDVAVPIPTLPEMMRRVEVVAAANGTTIASVAHAGDGNLHPFVVFDPREEDAERRAVASFEEIMRQAIELGGTITGEHGVGTLKRAFLAPQLGDALVGLQRRIKETFDPLGILNPGKVLPPR